MFRFRFVIDPTVNKNFPTGRKYIHARLTRLFKDSTKAFVETAVDAMLDDIDTGMSVATFSDLAAKLRMKTILKQQLRGRRTPVGGTYSANSPAFSAGNGEKKTTSLGQKLGRKAYDLEFGTPESPQFLFRFQIVVLQFYLHENGLAANSSHHWEALEKGKEAFISYWNKNLRRYINSKELFQILKTGRFAVLGEDLG